MDLRLMEEVRQAYRAAQSAGNPGGRLQVRGDLVTDPDTGKTYRVRGLRRLRVEELVLRTEVRHSTPARPREDVPCRSCGKAFSRSKFTPYLDECPECRGTARCPSAGARGFTCEKCGAAFTVSKFQPYHTPARCPRCVRNEGIRRRARRRVERGSAGQEQPGQ